MSSDDFVQRGQALVEQGRYQEAVKVCRLGLLARPADIAGRQILGRALLALHRYDEVLAEMRVALEIDEAHAPSLGLRGEALLYKGEVFQAAETLRLARAAAPSDPHILALSQKAEDALAFAGGRDGPGAFGMGPPTDMTRAYPAADEDTEMDTANSEMVTYPSDPPDMPIAAKPHATPPALAAPPSSVLAVGDKSGTMELDPELEGVELFDEMIGPPAEPPAASGRVGSASMRGGPAHVDDEDDSISFPETGTSQLSDLDIGEMHEADDSIDITTGVMDDVAGGPALSFPLPGDHAFEYRSPPPDYGGAPSGDDSYDLDGLPTAEGYLEPGSYPEPGSHREPGYDHAFDDSGFDVDDDSLLGYDDEIYDTGTSEETGFFRPAPSRDPDFDLDEADTRARPASRGGRDDPGWEFSPNRSPRTMPDSPRARGASGHEDTGARTLAPHLPRRPPPPFADDHELDLPPGVHPGRQTLAAGAAVPMPPLRRAPDGRASGSRSGPAPRAAIESAPAIEDLFPDDESGVSRIELAPGRTPAPPPGSVPLEGRGPGGGVSAVSKFAGNSPKPSLSADMAVIRAGLGMSPDRSELNMDAPNLPRPPSSQPAVRPAVMPQTSPVPSSGKPKRAMVGVNHEETSALPRRRSRWAYLAYVIIALGVLGGGVFAGFKIREVRLDRQIRATERIAIAEAEGDTYRGYLTAREGYAGIVNVRDTDSTRAKLLRIDAAIAAEFGEDPAAAGGQLDALGRFDNADVAVARAYLALARGDGDDALKRAAAVEQAYPGEPIGGYLTGRALLLAGDARAAVDAFRAAAERAPRPAVYAALGHALLSMREFEQAQAAFDLALKRVPDHPAATIGRAGVLARSGALAAMEPSSVTEIERSLEQFLTDDALAAGVVSRAQQAWAALTLARVKLARGEREAARTALDRAQKTRPLRDALFSDALTGLLLSLGDEKGAAAEAERAVTQWPRRVSARVVLAEVALLRDEPTRALAVLREAGDLSKNAIGLAMRGRVHLALEDLEAASADLEAALALKPDLRDALLARSEVDLERGIASAAVGRLEELYESDRSPDVAVVYAAALRRIEREDEARKILRELTKLPSPGRAYLELARLERDAGNFDAAIDTYAKAIDAGRPSITARREAALLALDTGDVKGAQAAISSLVTDAPDNARVLISAAQIQTIAGDPDQADALLDRAEKLDAVPLAWLRERERGRAALRRGDYPAAVKRLETARGLRDKDVDTHLLLIDSLLAQPKLEAAEQARGVMRKTQQTDPRFQLAIGRINWHKDLYAEAARIFEEARQKLVAKKATPRLLADVDAWLGRTYYYDTKFQAARKALLRAVKADKSHSDAWYFLGLTQKQLRDRAGALQSFKRAMAVDPLARPDVYFAYAETLYETKKWAAAKRAYQDYLERFPKGLYVEDVNDKLRQLR